MWPLYIGCSGPSLVLHLWVMFYRALYRHSLSFYYSTIIFSSTNCPVHCHADDFTLQDLHCSRLDAAKRLTFELPIISVWSRRNLLFFNVSKTFIFQLNSLSQTPIWYSSTKHVFPYSKVNIFGLFFAKNLNLKTHIYCIIKSASSVSPPPFFLLLNRWWLYTGTQSVPVWSVHHVFGRTSLIPYFWIKRSLRVLFLFGPLL